MDLGLKGKVALVTGGSRGIGRSICLGLAAEGCDVAFCARGEETLRATEAELKATGVRVFAQSVDVTNLGELDSFINETAQQLGRLDILVNNAGGSRPSDDETAWEESINLNLLSAVRATRAAIPHMRAHGSGSVIHISSIYGRESGGPATYNATKAAMIGHSKTLALQLAGEGIRVNTVAPGSISFPGGGWYRRQQSDPDGMAAFVKQNIAAGRFGAPEEVANAVVFLASPRASFITGTNLIVDGALTQRVQF
jgi:3-oxoacyl-[acyl-carrier protein] reductase